MPKYLDVSYDPATDILTVEGIRFSGAFFRHLGCDLRCGDLFEFVNRDDDVVTIKTHGKLQEATESFRRTLRHAVRAWFPGIPEEMLEERQRF